MTRRALVIGCGGTIGGAWITAALSALCRQIGVAAGDFDVVQGTSAGAELATMIGAGFTAVAETTIATVGVAIERWGSVGLCAAGVSACGCHPAASPTRRG